MSRAWTSADLYAAVARGELQGTKKERYRIRRLIGPALREIRDHANDAGCGSCIEHCAAIDRITRPESKRKRASAYPWCSCGKCAPCPDRGKPGCSHDDEHPYRFNLKRCRDAYEAATSKRKVTK